MELLASLKESLLDLVYPRPGYCLYCQENELRPGQFKICEECLLEIDYITEGYCQKCGKLLAEVEVEEQLCADCEDQNYKFSRARAAATYASIGDYIYQLKYEKKQALAQPLGEILGVCAVQFYNPRDLDLIIPVPVSAKKLKKRGFNQANLLAQEVAKKLDLEVNNEVLKRAVDTVSQSKLSLAERKENVKDIFYCEPKQVKEIKEQTLLLVDDIYTTGSTANECAKVLLRAGAAEVKVLTLATGRQEN
ncbi:ComF family protein [Fuchsiella alkaliacetigena]|uniref:ComF family protein n=1 Tax=Fuchsiella alkaliacetigena TaxID=957042 RepID=UPI00200B0CFA|nr:ComF family protein [Fuchsiella alkaliacetigena]MCK8824168.1 ComF family protein [Fuchsiella alkaliacetigena]